MVKMLPKVRSYSWLNSWAISLDANKWETDGLFNPKSEPRNFSIIKQQLWEVIGR